MLAALLIALREGLEAVLIVAIVHGLLRRLGHADRARPLWLGVAAAVATSIVAGLGLHLLGVAFEGQGEQIFEGLTMLLAAGVLTWMILWMQRQGRQVRAGLEREVRAAVEAGSAGMLFGLSFVAVVREGIETALFLSAAAFGSTPMQTLTGAALGLLIAVGAGWLMLAAGRQLDLRTFFRVTGFLLVLFAAGLLARGLHELQEAALLPVLVEHLWDVNPILNEESTVGSLLQALFGYSGSPSLLQVVGYAGYLLAVWVGPRLGLPRERRLAGSRP
jgi:high-affinity iron transporter